MGWTCKSEGARKLTADIAQLPLSGRRGAGLRCGLGGMLWRPAVYRAPEPFTSSEDKAIADTAPRPGATSRGAGEFASARQREQADSLNALLRALKIERQEREVEAARNNGTRFAKVSAVGIVRQIAQNQASGAFANIVDKTRSMG
jgi:hypothetical protein